MPHFLIVIIGKFVDVLNWLGTFLPQPTPEQMQIPASALTPALRKVLSRVNRNGDFHDPSITRPLLTVGSRAPPATKVALERRHLPFRLRLARS